MVEKHQGEAVISSKKNKDGRRVWLCSVTVAEQPEVSGIVRAVHGPGCQMIVDTGAADKCKFVWLMDCDYKGMIPGSVVDIVMPSAQLQMIDCINKLAA